MHYGSQGQRNLGIGEIRVVPFSIHIVNVDLCMKGCFHLRRRAAEHEHTMPTGNRFHFEAMSGEPTHHLVEIAV